MTRSNLAYANAHRPAALFAGIVGVLMRRAGRLHAHEPFLEGMDGKLFAIDSTLIDLSVQLMPWARVHGSFAALKLHVQLALAPSLPTLCVLTEGKVADVTFLDQLAHQPGAYYVMDRGYFDFARLERLHAAGATFVTRSKCNTRSYVVASRKISRSKGLRCDQTVRFNSAKGRQAYPHPVRRIRVLDPESGQSIVLLSNNFTLPPETIAAIYRHRWQIELFFRWIKQHLRLRAFFAHSPNGIAIQIWTALAAYLLVAIARKRLHLPQELVTILQIVSISALEKVPLHELLMESTTRSDETGLAIQLEFKGL